MRLHHRLTAILVRQLRLAATLLCVVPIQSALAGDVFSADNGDLRYRTLAVVSSVAFGDMHTLSGNHLPNLAMRNTLIIGTGATLVAAYGLHNWWDSGFDGNFETTNEGWFGSGTQFGGADKLGHLYGNYAGVRLLTPLFEAAGNNRDVSISLAAWSTLAVYSAVEVVDGYSRNWKFSPQDAIANAAGAAFGVLLDTHPELDAAIDFRLDYSRSLRAPEFDPFGDYSSQKYLLVVKADGLGQLRDNRLLRYFEVSLGYGTRGFDSGNARYRDIYVGLSLNLARLLADGAYDGRMHATAFQRGTDRLFELVQFPTITYEHRSMK